jgi:putative oxidoreductase
MHSILTRQGFVERPGSTTTENVMKSTLEQASISGTRGSGKRTKEPMTLSKLIDWMWTPPDSAPRSTILIRCMVGGVFLWEGILKFVYTNQGVGRFAKIGIPAPELMAHFVGVLEIVGGVLLISGFLTRLIAVPFVIEMVVAILSTKVALYLGTSPLPLPPAPPQIGAWAVLHEIRSDYAQIMSVLFLFVAGPGPWSVDAILARVSQRRAAAGALSPTATASHVTDLTQPSPPRSASRTAA